LEESEEKDINSDSKIPIAPRMTIDKLFSKKVLSFKLFVAFSASSSEEKVSIMC